MSQPDASGDLLPKTSIASRLRLVRLTLGNLFEVAFDDLAIARRHVAGKLGHRLDSIFFRQLAPLLGIVRQPLLVDIAGTWIGGGVAIRHRLAGVRSAAWELAAVRT